MVQSSRQNVKKVDDLDTFAFGNRHTLVINGQVKSIYVLRLYHSRMHFIFTVVEEADNRSIFSPTLGSIDSSLFIEGDRRFRIIIFLQGIPLPPDNSTMERSSFRFCISLLKCSILFYDGKHSIVLNLINATTTYIQRTST